MCRSPDVCGRACPLPVSWVDFGWRAAFCRDAPGYLLCLCVGWVGAEKPRQDTLPRHVPKVNVVIVRARCSPWAEETPGRKKEKKEQWEEEEVVVVEVVEESEKAATKRAAPLGCSTRRWCGTQISWTGGYQ